MKFRYKVAQLLYGRYITYGIDTLTKLLTAICILLAVINIVLQIFGQDIVAFILYVIESLIFLFVFYRLFSRNISKRQNENLRVNSFFQKFKNIAILKKRIRNDRETHVYKKCPHCSVMLRLPKKPGEHTVNCPRCKNDFKVKVK